MVVHVVDTVLVLEFVQYFDFFELGVEFEESNFLPQELVHFLDGELDHTFALGSQSVFDFHLHHEARFVGELLPLGTGRDLLQFGECSFGFLEEEFIVGLLRNDRLHGCIINNQK